MVNVLAALDGNAESDLKEAKEKASHHLKKYIEQRTLIAELEAMIEVRKAMGAQMTEEVLPMKREA